MISKMVYILRLILGEEKWKIVLNLEIKNLIKDLFLVQVNIQMN